MSNARIASPRNYNQSPRGNNVPQVKALFDYVPDASFGGGKFLSFKTGDIITVIDKCEGGWWKGILHNKEGLFPPTYCEELPPRRVLNVDTKKASPSIKRIQTMLKLTVTGTGEQVEEVEQEAQEPSFTRERSQSDAHIFKFSSTGKNSTGLCEVAKQVIEGKKLLESVLEEERAEEKRDEAHTDEHAEPAIKETPKEGSEVSQLKIRIAELESEKVSMIAVFRLEKERLEDEMTQRISELNHMLEQKSLMIEIMKKDLEIIAEENKENTLVLELEIDRLTRTCEDLEEKLAHLTPIGDNALSPRDTRSLPSAKKPHNLPTPRLPSSAPASPSLSSTSSSPLLSSGSSSGASTPLKRSSVHLSPPVSPGVPKEDPTPAVSPTPGNPPPQSKTFVPPVPQKCKSLPSLSLLPRELSGPSSSPRSKTPRLPTTPRLLYSPALLDSPSLAPSDPRSKINNFEESLAKLASLGPHPAPPALSLDLPGSALVDPTQVAVEISELKRRIAELEAERLQMIEDYRNRKAPSPLEGQTTNPPLPIPPTPPTTTEGDAPLKRPLTVDTGVAGGKAAIIEDYQNGKVPGATEGQTTPPPSTEDDPSLALRKTATPLDTGGVADACLTRSKAPATPIDAGVTHSSTPPVPALAIPLKKSSNLPPLPPTPVQAPSAPSFAISPPSSSVAPITTSLSSTPSSSSSGLQERPTRKRNKEKGASQTGAILTAPSPSRPTGPNADSLNTANRNLTWLQASVCVAVGSAAFYVVQTIVRHYHS
jgi:hypothetical protein